MNQFDEYESKLHDSLMNQLKESESNPVAPIHVGKNFINRRELDVGYALAELGFSRKTTNSKP